MNIWDIIVSSYNKMFFSREDEIQKAWEEMFADASIFGYSKFMGEIDSHRKMHIGSVDRIIPDIIIRDAINNKDLFIVELKQYKIGFNTNYKSQLFSYMRFANVKIGILICDKIYVYYLNDDVEKESIIPFEQSNINGIKLCNLLKKDNYSIEKVVEFIENNEKVVSDIEAIKNDLSSEKIKEIVVEYYKQLYTEEVVEGALSNIDFTINTEDDDWDIDIDDIVDASQLKKKSNVINDYNFNYNESIQDYIKRVLAYLYNNNLLSEIEITKLHDINYCKKTFNIKFALLCDNLDDCYYSGQYRYWTKWKLGRYFV